MSRGLAIVVAHPDDDTWGQSGTAILHADDPDFRLTVVLLTSGDAGEIADPALATPENLGPVREEEDRASWRTLGRVPDRHEFFRILDGHVPDAPRDEVVDRIAAVLADERPDVVITMEPGGITGHVDHMATSDLTTEAFHRVRADGGPGLRRLLYHGLPQGDMDHWAELMAAAGMPLPDPDEPFAPKGVPNERFGVHVDTSAVWERRLAALQEHRTQADGRGFPDDAWPAILGEEHYIVAWPERPADAPDLHDVFENL